MNKLLKEIDFGEPDANAEYIISLRSKQLPLYIRAWSQPEIRNYEGFENGSKFIISGQKGTGKTAILRQMEASAKNLGYVTEFIVFKNEIIREAELLKVDYSNFNGSVVDEDKLKSNKFYYHAIKRVMVSLLISKLKVLKVDANDPQKSLIERLIGSSGKEALRFAFDSIVNIAQSSEVDLEKLSKGFVKIDPAQLLKKTNDELLTKAVRLSLEENPKIRIYFDEMHFAYRDKESLHSDAALVRDTILAAQALNERFAQEGLDIVIYIAIRKEFLDQPEIAEVDVVHVIESYGEAITWEHYPADSKHPIFDFIALRFAIALGKKFTRKKLLDTYLKNIDPEDLLTYTWSKPRDLVRFFKAAQGVDGNTVVIGSEKYKIILRTYCNQAWQECKSALAAFIPADVTPSLENALKILIQGQFDGGKTLGYDRFCQVIKPSFDKATASGVRYDIHHFCKVLYMLGVFYYYYDDVNGQRIYQQYHRGNANPPLDGNIRIHSAVAKALS